MRNEVMQACMVTAASILLFYLIISCFVIPVSLGNDVTKSPSKPKKLQIGVKKRVENCDKKSKKGDVLHMHYKGTLEDNTEFDNSYSRGEPLTFTLGSGQVIRGWDQGLLGMCEGEKRKLVIPPDLGYGSAGAPPTIPGPYAIQFSRANAPTYLDNVRKILTSGSVSMFEWI